MVHGDRPRGPAATIWTTTDSLSVVRLEILTGQPLSLLKSPSLEKRVPARCRAAVKVRVVGLFEDPEEEEVHPGATAAAEWSVTPASLVTDALP